MHVLPGHPHAFTHRDTLVRTIDRMPEADIQRKLAQPADMNYSVPDRREAAAARS